MDQATHHESKVSRRLTEQTAPEVCDLIYLPRLAGFNAAFPYLTEINEAHLLMLHGRRLVSTTVAQKLASAILQMDRDGPEKVTLDPQREDAYFNYEAHLISLTEPDIGGRLHTARSRNDILATIDRLVARDQVIALLDSLGSLRQTVLERATQHIDTVMPGYTHLQPAQPITYGFYLAGIAQALERDSHRLAQAYDRINLSPLGAGAFAGTPFAIDREETARLLGFPGVIDNTLDAVASRDFIFEIMAALTLLATTWSRIAQDYFVWSTDEFGLIHFPDSVAGTSSIMPQKKNPVVLEYLKGRAGKVLGLFTGAMASLKGTNFSHTGDANRESIAGFPEMILECQYGLELLKLVIHSAEPRKDEMLNRARRNFCSATDLADALVSEADISFRQAHHIVGAVVREAMDAHRNADEITAEMVNRAALNQTGTRTILSSETVQTSLDPLHSVKKRERGGPAPASVNSTIEHGLDTLKCNKRQNESRRKTLAESRTLRRQQTTELAQP